MRAVNEHGRRAYKPRAVNEEKERKWRSVFDRFHRSTLPFKKFCAQENISPNTFQYWRRELRKRDETRGITSMIFKGDNRPSNLQQNVDYWLEIIKAVNAHNGSVRSYCRIHGIASGSLHFWEKRLKEMKLTKGICKERPVSNSQFVPVQVLDDHPQLPENGAVEASHQRIEIKRSDGLVVSLPSSTSAHFLIQLVNGFTPS
ncbi:MAG TPA: hypothetical protein V6C86_17570 [Oculatellaceae cyanobacterium]